MVVFKDSLPNNLTTWFNNSGFRNKLLAVVVTNVFGQMKTPRQPGFAFNAFVNPTFKIICVDMQHGQTTAKHSAAVRTNINFSHLQRLAVNRIAALRWKRPRFKLAAKSINKLRVITAINKAAFNRQCAVMKIFKRWIHERIEREPGLPGGFHLPEDVSDDYCKQLVSEARIVKPSGKVVWQKIFKDNHYFDCEVLQVAGAYSLNLQQVTAEQLQAQVNARKVKTQAAVKQREGKKGDPFRTNRRRPAGRGGGWFSK